ncbi:dihydrofolate reductase [Bacteroidia bacterium]|nr:dihydrofolate reductase [Bacteroidia bacterium]
MQISLVVAMAHRHAIGNNNQLLCRIPEDLAHFKRLTTGHSVVMGRRTFESIGHPLPHRNNIVISRTQAAWQGVQVFPNLTQAFAALHHEEEVFVIGGAMLYKAALPFAHRIYATLIDADFDADAFFPTLDLTEWTEISRENFLCGQNFLQPFSFVVWQRRIGQK